MQASAEFHAQTGLRTHSQDSHSFNLQLNASAESLVEASAASLSDSVIQESTSSRAPQNSYSSTKSPEKGMGGEPEPTLPPFATPTFLGEDVEEFSSQNQRSYASQAPKGTCEPPQVCLQDRNRTWAGRPHGYNQIEGFSEYISPRNLRLAPLETDPEQSFLPTQEVLSDSFAKRSASAVDSEPRQIIPSAQNGFESLANSCATAETLQKTGDLVPNFQPLKTPSNMVASLQYK